MQNNENEDYWVRFRTEVKALLSEHLGQPIIPDDEIGLKEAAGELGYTTSTLYKMVGTKKVPFKKQGPKRLVFSRRELKEWKLANIK